MIRNVPINIIIYMFWNTNELVDLPLSYMNIVYKITLASEVNVVFKTVVTPGALGVKLVLDDEGELQGTIDINQYEDLKIDAQESFFLANPDKGSNGLSFRWECAMEGEHKSVAIQQECQKWDGSPVLQIPHGVIEANDYTNKATIIKVVVTSIEASEASNFDVQFRSGATFTWLTTVRPEFKFKFPLPDLKDGKIVLVSQEQIISVEPIGWRSSDGYRFNYKLYNTNNDEKTLIKEVLSSNSQEFRIEAFELEYESFYTIEVEVTNPGLEGIEPVKKESEFYTGVKPEAGLMTISPEKGTMFSTYFNVKLQNYRSTYYDSANDTGRMSYILYGVVDPTDASKNLRLMASFRDITNPALTDDFDSQLPQVVAVLAEIKDAHGEVVTIQKEVEVNRDDSQKWADIYIKRKETTILQI